MKKILKLMLIMCILLFTLAGCVNVNYEIKLNENGSADVTYVYAYEKETLKQLEVSSEDMTNEMKKKADENGYKTEKYSDEKIEGFKASKHFDDISKISITDVFGEEYVTEKENSTIKIEKNGFKTIFSQNAQINLNGIDSQTSSLLTIKYIIKLPVPVGISNASDVSKDGKTLTWDIKPEAENKIEFQAVKYINMLYIYLAIVIVVCILILSIILLKRKKLKSTKINKHSKKVSKH